MKEEGKKREEWGRRRITSPWESVPLFIFVFHPLLLLLMLLLITTKHTTTWTLDSETVQIMARQQWGQEGRRVIK